MGQTTELDTIGAGLERGVNGEKRDTMMVVGTPPWHYSYNEDLITLLDGEAKIKAAEVNKVAGLDWEIYQVPAFIAVGKQPTVGNDGLVIPESAQLGGGASPQYKMVGTQLEKDKKPTPDYWCNVRDDSHSVVGIVKKGYRVFQNADAPEFLDTLVDTGDAFFETAGSLHGGSQVWWLMRIPQGITVDGQDSERLQSYILFSNSHDGSLSLTVAIVTVRVVCQNTLSYALSGAKRSVKIRHTKSATSKIQAARKALEVGFKYQTDLAEVAERMLETPLTDADFEGFLNEIAPLPEAKHDINDDGVKTINQFAITVAKKRRDAIIDVYNTHPTQQPIKGTLWGAVQAVSFYSDHLAFTRSEESRFARLIKGQQLGGKAFTKALELIPS